MYWVKGQAGMVYWVKGQAGMGYWVKGEAGRGEGGKVWVVRGIVKKEMVGGCSGLKVMR